MFEEIFPASKSYRSLKVLTPPTKLVSNLPSVESHISFLPFVNFLKEKLETVSATRADFYSYLIRKFEHEPGLLEPVADITQLDEHSELLDFLSTAIFPLVCADDDNNYTFAAPYNFNIFSYSGPFRELFIDPEEQFLKLPDDLSNEHLREVHCAMIYDHVLEKYYGIKLNEKPDLTFPVTDLNTGMRRYYRMRYDRRFINLKLKGKLPEIQDCAVCLNTFRILDLEQQLKTMPLDLFRAEGFAVWIAEDVTTTESLDEIKKILLVPDDCQIENVNELKTSIQTLIGLNNVQVGLMPFFKMNDSFLLNEECTRQSLLGKYWRANDEQSMQAFRNFIRFQRENPKPMPISNLDESLLDFAPFLKPLYQEGTRSYIYYPMQNSDGLLGMLELASTVPNLLNQQLMAHLEPAIPLISLAMLKSREAFSNKIEKVVKEKFTALQPSVEWKFAEVAWNYLQTKDPTAETGKIAFENVFPLYGAIDIRNSSIERSYAIQKDLKEHLHIINDTLDQLLQHVRLTLLEELKFKGQKFQQSIADILFPEDEVRLNEFLLNEVTPVFSHLQKSDGDIQTIIEEYFTLERNCHGPIYHHRNEYEETLALINQTVSNYLDDQDQVLQLSYPHYFEKYRTDGVEYNVYIGQSMAPGHSFDLLYLKNMRLWQLQSMVEIARITHQILPDLKVPLETTQMIFIYNKPLTINFRKDERRFDVEGSSDIRYEVMKKRIDKALIKDTGERLTQPGKIAMVYSNLREAQEYEEYIHFLQSKSLIQPEIEYVTLEEMQGVKGLKALRVTVIMN